MARRRTLEAPSPEQLREIEAGVDQDLSTRLGVRPPIADVVADAAIHADPLPQGEREEIARNRVDAARMREAENKGLVAVEIPIHEVTADALSRDRMNLDDEEMRELAASISRNGLRLPIEVFEPANPEAAGRYALISGFRRLAAFRNLNTASGGEHWQTIPAFIRQPSSFAETLVAMVEENEVRAGLSQYERGRAAAMAVYDGVFETIDEAVTVLFRQASKAKRSKIRSFALIHEELGDMLNHATSMSERQCLRLASALRGGLAEDLRAALEEAAAGDAAGEWNVMLPLIERVEGGEADPARGGRPRAKTTVTRSGRVQLANGVSIEKEHGPNGWAIRFHGRNVTADMVDAVMENVRHLLEPI